MTINEMEMDLLKLENDIIELEQEKNEYTDGQQKFNYIMNKSPQIDNISSNLVGDINNSFQCGSLTSKIAPVLTEVGSGYNRRINDMTYVAEQKNKDCEYKIEQKLREIEDLKYRIELQKSIEFNY